MDREAIVVLGTAVDGAGELVAILTSLCMAYSMPRNAMKENVARLGRRWRLERTCGESLHGTAVEALTLRSSARRSVRISRSQRTRPNRPSTLPRAFRNCANWSTTSAREKKEKYVVMNVGSSICARPANVCTTE